MHFIRTVLVLAVVGVVAVLGYNYWTGNGLTFHPPSSSTGIDPASAREKGEAIVDKTAATASQAASKVEEAVSESTLTAKIKAKMALDDYVKARSISVSTTGSVVTLTGTVETKEERDRAERLARETLGVTSVVNKLEVKAKKDK